MKLTHAYKTKATLSGFRISFQRLALTFIRSHAGAFEALTRQATPFGGSWLPTSTLSFSRRTR